MSTQRPAKSDSEIAAALFESDLASAMGTDRAAREGWRLTRVDPLTAIVEVFGRAVDGSDSYFLKLQGDWYDQYPPRVAFVLPKPEAGWPEAGVGDRWLPVLETTQDGFLLHPDYTFPDQSHGQLICSSVNLDYYWDHPVDPPKCWKQGKDKLIWTLSVIQNELSGPGYKGPSSAASS